MNSSRPPELIWPLKIQPRTKDKSKEKPRINLDICTKTNEASSSKGEDQVAKENKILQQIFIAFLHFCKRTLRFNENCVRTLFNPTKPGDILIHGWKDTFAFHAQMCANPKCNLYFLCLLVSQQKTETTKRQKTLLHYVNSFDCCIHEIRSRLPPRISF